MRCRRIQDMLPPYLSGELPATGVQAVESHLEDCPSCRAEMRAMRQALTALQSPVRQFEPPDLLEQVKLKAMEKPSRPSIAGPRLAWAAAAAAVVVVLLAINLRPGAKNPPAKPSVARASEDVVRAGPRHSPPPRAAVGDPAKKQIVGAFFPNRTGRLISGVNPRNANSARIRRPRLRTHVAVRPTGAHSQSPDQQTVVEGVISDAPMNGRGETYVREDGRLYRAMSFTGPDGEIRTVPIRRLPFYDQPRREIDLGDYAVRVARDNGAGTDYIREVR